MAGFNDEFESDLTRLIFNAVAIANIADNAASAPLTNLWVALHSGDPGDTGTQGTLETTYSDYERVITTRATSTGGWATSTTVGQASPVSNIDFPQHTGASTETATHASVGVTSAATDAKILAAGALSPVIQISQNVTPRITTGSSFTLD